MLNDIHRRLREATATDHQRLETRLAVHEQIASRAGRAALIARYWRFHGRAEAALAPWLSQLDGLDFEGRLRTPLIARDFADLGLDAPADAGEGAPVESRGEALGVLYVLEGSALGGRAIRRQLAARGADLIGLGFLDPYGGQTGERWRSFLDVLERETADAHAADAAVAGALAGFRQAEAELCEAGADV
jgi:heme oxygenase